MKDRVRPFPARGISVRHDWCAWLPDEKEKFFHRNRQELESSYTMWSITLDEAISLHREGQFGKSLLAVGVSSELCRLLTEPLLPVCMYARSFGRHGLLMS